MIQTATIADGSDTSSSIQLGNSRFVVISVDANFGGTSLTLKHQNAAGLNQTTKSHDGTSAAALAMTVSAGETYIPVGDLATAVAALEEFVFVSDASQSGSDCVITVQTK